MNADIEMKGDGGDEAVKPCPFCGHKAGLINTLLDGATDDPPTCHVYCPNCLAQGPAQEMTAEATNTEMDRAEREAVAQWNRRSPVAQTKGANHVETIQ